MTVDDGGEPEAVPPGLRHVGDPHSGVCLRHPLGPDLQTSEAGHQHPDGRRCQNYSPIESFDLEIRVNY